MRYVEYGDPLFLESFNKKKELSYFVVSKGGCGFIHYNYFRVKNKGLAYFNDLLISNRELSNDLFRVEGRIEESKRLLTLFPHDLPVHHPNTAGRFPPEKYILCNGKIFNNR